MQIGALPDRKARDLAGARLRRRPTTASQEEMLCNARGVGICQHVAPALEQALRILQPSQLLPHADADMAVRPDAPCARCREVGGCVEDAIAEIRLGGRTQTDRRTAACHVHALLGGHMRGMHQAPARI